MLHKQFIVDAYGASPAELNAALVAAGTALGASDEPESASGVNFVVRRRTGRRSTGPLPQARSQLRLLRYAVLGSALSMSVAVLMLGQAASRQASHSLPPALQPAHATSVNATAAPRPTRRVYAYSVVPGGVVSREEVIAAMKLDHLVAAHYADFDVNAAVLRKVEPRAAYVSYRKDGKIFWTRQKVALKAGESVLSDGVHQIRARCGNRISNDAQLPVAMAEPPSEVLDEYMEDDDPLPLSDESRHTKRSLVNGGQALPHGQVPEPGSLALLGFSLVILAGVRRRKAVQAGSSTAG